MKKGLIMIVMLCASIAGRAQDVDYFPMLTYGKYWDVCFQQVYKIKDSPDYVSYRYNYYRCRLGEKEMFDGKQCYRLEKSGLSEEIGADENFSFVCYMYEEDQRVYVYLDGEWKVEFDFNLKEGDSFGDNRVKSLQTYMNRRGETARLLIYPEFIWVEGMGSSAYGPLNRPLYDMPEALPGLYLETVACVYAADKDGWIYYNYNSSNGIEECSFPSNLLTVIYDLQGRRLTSKPEKGVYIEGGRKRVAGK